VVELACCVLFPGGRQEAERQAPTGAKMGWVVRWGLCWRVSKDWSKHRGRAGVTACVQDAVMKDQDLQKWLKASESWVPSPHCVLLCSTLVVVIRSAYPLHSHVA
jgi:hypothetical protein